MSTTQGGSAQRQPITTIADAVGLLQHLEAEMKSYEFALDASRHRLNTSLALAAVQALQDLLQGQADDAADDFAMVAEELRARSHLREIAVDYVRSDREEETPSE